MAEQILQRLKSKLTLPADNSLSTEKVLESLAYERRATGGYGLISPMILSSFLELKGRQRS
jgi:hypothetical protein